ncbi:MAG: MBL fold metallo-hydrolase [Thermomicrobiales bacterium]
MHQWSLESRLDPRPRDRRFFWMTIGKPFTIRRFPHGVTMIQESDQREVVAAYLVEGTRDLAVIDTGLGSGGFPELVRTLSSRRPMVLQTHRHWDHIGASDAFKDVRAHPAEQTARWVGWPWEPDSDAGNCDATATGREPSPSITWAPGASLTCASSLNHGDRIALGGRTLEVLHTPGHSPGGLSFLERDAGTLFSGDLVYFGQMLLFVSGSDRAAYRESLHALSEIVANLDAIYPSHGDVPLHAQDVIAIRDAFESVWNGKAPNWHGTYSGRRVAIHDFGRFSFLLPPGDWRKTG